MREDRPLPFHLKVFRVFTRQPQRLWQHARGFALFTWTRLLAPFVFDQVRYQIGENVRLQNIASLLVSELEGRLAIGAHSILYEHARIEVSGRGQLSIGEGSILGDVRISCRERVTLGARLLTSWNVFIQDFDPHPSSVALRADQMRHMTNTFRPSWSKTESSVMTPSSWAFPTAPIEIGDDVWLGTGVIILKGVKIGQGSIVAAGSVVTGGEFPPRSLIGGNPAKWIKELQP